MAAPRNNLDELRRRRIDSATSSTSSPAIADPKPRPSKFKAAAPSSASGSVTARPLSVSSSLSSIPLQQPAATNDQQPQYAQLMASIAPGTPRNSTVPAKRESPEGQPTSVKRLKTSNTWPPPTRSGSGLDVDMDEAQPISLSSDGDLRASQTFDLTTASSSCSLSKKSVEELEAMRTNNHATLNGFYASLVDAMRDNSQDVDTGVLEIHIEVTKKRIKDIDNAIQAHRASSRTRSNTPSHLPPDGNVVRRVISPQPTPRSLRTAGVKRTSSYPSQPSPSSRSTAVVSSFASTSRSATATVIDMDDFFYDDPDYDDIIRDHVICRSPAPTSRPRSPRVKRVLQPVQNTLDSRLPSPRSSPVKRSHIKPTPTATTKTTLRTTSHATSTPYDQDIMRTLKKTFKLDGFRPNQLEAVSATMSGRDVFVLMPTGGGKSLCYQLPAVCSSGKTRGVTVVFSPLKALMHDQTRALRELNIDVVNLNSDQDEEVSREGRARLVGSGPKPKLLYVTPEKFEKNEDFKSILGRLHRDGQLARFVIDEAHVLSSWGRDFRASYQCLSRLKADFPGVPIMALTATANEQTKNDIIDQLGIRDGLHLSQSFNRSNLFYEVRQKKGTLLGEIPELIKSRFSGQTGIIYCLSRDKCETVATQLRDTHGIRALHFHAQISTAEKQEALAAWQSGECQVIVATIAFGMGIDKANVRFVIHQTFPMSLDGYYQETGRAGRDDYSYSDCKTVINLIKKSTDTSDVEKKRQEEAARRVVGFCSNVADCRRVQVLQFFGEDFKQEDCNRQCDICVAGIVTHEKDMSDAACDAVSLVQSMTDGRQRITRTQVQHAFLGANIKAVRDKGHDRAALFGTGQALGRDLVERLFDHLLAKHVLIEESIKNGAGWNNMYIQLGPSASDILRKKEPFVMRVLDAKGSTHQPKDKGKGKGQTKGTVQSASRSRAKDRSFFAEEDDEPVDDYDDVIGGTDDVDLDDIYNFNSPNKQAAMPSTRSGPAHSLPALPTKLSSRRVVPPLPEPTKPTAKPIADRAGNSDASDIHAQCRRDLIVLRSKLAKENATEDQNVLSDYSLDMASAILPKDPFAFKEILNQDEDNDATLTNANFVLYGRQFLPICIRWAMQTDSSVAGQAPISPKLVSRTKGLQSSQFVFKSGKGRGFKPA